MVAAAFTRPSLYHHAKELDLHQRPGLQRPAHFFSKSTRQGSQEMSQSMTAMPATMPALAANGATKLSNSWIHVANTSVVIGSAWGNRAIRLAGRRLARNRAAVERLSHCASWQDLLELQMTWAKDVMQDYFDESREFLSLVQKAANAPAEVV